MKSARRINLERSIVDFELVKDRIPARVAESIRKDIYVHKKWGLGVETIVDVLLEDEIDVSIAQIDAIVEAMNAMGLKRSQHKIRVVE